jgi:hypothetical protein
MMNSTMRRVALSALLLLPLLASAPAAAQPAPDRHAAPNSAAANDDADTLFEKGMAALSAGHTQQAYDLDLAAWKLKQTHDIAGNLAQVELMLGKKRDAAEHIAFALAHFPPTVSSDRREGLKKVLDGLRKELGVLRVRVSVAEARVVLDGTPLGPASLAGEVFVEPGPHVVEATLAGYKPARAPVDAAKGSAQDVTLELVKIAEPPPARRSVVPGAVLGGIAGAALVTGIGLYAGGRAKIPSVRTLHDSIVSAGHNCTPGAPTYDARCGDLTSQAATGTTLQQVGDGLMIGAGAVAVGTLIYFVAPSSAGTIKSGSLRVTPALSPSATGLVFSGSF